MKSKRRHHKCSLPQWRVQEIKHMYLASLTHGLLITLTQYSLDASTHMCSDTYTHSTFMNIALLANPPLASLFCLLLVSLRKWTTPFYSLGDPFSGDRGANVHPHSSPVGDWLPPLLRNPPPPLPTTPTVHVTCLLRRHHNISYTVWYNKAIIAE